jgi:putative transposase
LINKLQITIESINFQLRKITKNRGHFPDKDAAMKLIYLGLRNISSQRGVAVQLVGGLVGWWVGARGVIGI